MPNVTERDVAGRSPKGREWDARKGASRQAAAARGRLRLHGVRAAPAPEKVVTRPLGKPVT